jgi:hypothetical protein
LSVNKQFELDDIHHMGLEANTAVGKEWEALSAIISTSMGLLSVALV